MDPTTQAPIPQSVTQDASSQSSPALTWLLITLTIFVVIVGLGAAYLFMTKPLVKPSNQQSASQPAQPTGIPQMKITDLSPGVPNGDKTVILVQHSDSSQEKVIIQTSLAAGYIKSLPEGEKALSQTPVEQ